EHRAGRGTRNGGRSRGTHSARTAVHDARRSSRRAGTHFFSRGVARSRFRSGKREPRGAFVRGKRDSLGRTRLPHGVDNAATLFRRPAHRAVRHSYARDCAVPARAALMIPWLESADPLPPVESALNVPNRLL